MKHVMDGYKVLDMTQFLAGPAATRILVEAGAEVIKVEWPTGDPSRRFPFIGKDGRSAYYVQQNRGKRSVALDLKSAEAIAIVKDLATKCDVLIENFAPGVMDRLGLGYEAVKAVNPKIVMCSISAFGQSGPLAQLPGFDNIGQAYSGITSMIGDPDKTPSFPMAAIGDVSTGVHAACAVAFALLYRERTGKGQWVDISLLDSYFHYHEVNVQLWSCSGGEVKPTRSGSHHYAVSPAGAFQGKTSPIFILPAAPQMWVNLCELMGRKDLVTDPRFVDNGARAKNQKELIPIIEAWMQAQESDAKTIRMLEDARIPVAPILSVEEACQHPHLIQRETVRWIYDRTLGSFQAPGMPLRFSEFPGHLDLVAPYVGEHNAAVLSDYLGYSSARIDELVKKGVLHAEPIPAQAAARTA